MISNVVKIKLDEILKDKKKSLYKVQQETGVAYSTLWKLKEGKVESITFDVLEKVCTNLECTPNDLLAIEK